MIEPYVNKIIIVDEEFLSDLKHESRTDYHKFLNPNIDTKVLTLPLKQSEIGAIAPFIDPSSIRSGSIVVKPGYTDQFVSIDAFAEELIQRKYGLFSQLCVALGAKKISITSIDDVSLEDKDTTSFEGGLSASHPLAKAEVNIKAKQSSQSDDFRKSVMKLITEAEGAEPNFNEADRLMAQFGLQKDSLFTDILNMCRGGTNRLRRHEVSIDCSKDVKRVFDSTMQANIKAMSKLYGGKAEFDKASSSVEKNKVATRLSVVVEFS
jgi:hypothetical protein